MKKDITVKLSTPGADFWANVEVEIRQLVDIPSKASVVHVLTFVYAEFHDVSIPSSLPFSEERLTGPLEGLNIINACAMLIWDDGHAAGKVVVEGNRGADEVIDIGNNDKKYWIILVKPEQKCRVFGRCKFWLCRSRDIPSRAGVSVGYISDWSQWAWYGRRNQFGRYRLFQGVYEYDWRDPGPSTS
jgi:hypothetical protein